MIQMNNLLRRKSDKRGFTLAELLVVVAIIAVMVAISIPIFTAQLDKAKEATDDANERAAKAAAVVEYLSGDGDREPGTAITGVYDAENGIFIVDGKNTSIADYGKGSTVDSVTRNGVIEVEVEDGEVTLTWK